MRRCSRAGGQLAKSLRRKAATSGRRDAPKAARRRSSSAAAGQETKVAQLSRELSQAAEQQTATADVLKLTADGHVRSVKRHRQLIWRAAAGVPGHAGERGAHLRGQIWIYESI